MADAREIVDRAIRELEALQSQIGAIQVSLLEILADEEVDHWDETAQAALIKLENVQRDVGEVQVQLLRRMGGSIADEAVLTDAPLAHSMDQTGEDKPILPSPKTLTAKGVNDKAVKLEAWLNARGIKVKSVAETSGLDGAAGGPCGFLPWRTFLDARRFL